MFTSPFDPHSLMLMNSFWTVFMWIENQSWQQHCLVLLLLLSFIQILDVKKKVAGKKVKVSLNCNVSDQINVEKLDGLITTAKIIQ